MDLTKGSEKEFNLLSTGQMTPAMAAAYLREGRVLARDFWQTLEQLYARPDLLTRLTAALREYEPEAEEASLARKVRNWAAGRNRPSKREEVFRVAFALGLGEPETSLLLGLCSDYGIHYRDGREVVYAWFLRNRRSYREAMAFYKSLPPVPRLEKAGGLPPHATYEMQNRFLRVQTEEDLRQCYCSNLKNMGVLHSRAYFYFDKYLKQLIRPSPLWDSGAEADYSVETVMEKYLSLHMPSGRDRRQYSIVQKLIKRDWPNATALKNIRLRQADVPRKLILLLYVITENVVDGFYHEMDEDYISTQERLEDHWWTLNAILADCGMPSLDLRNAMDWLVVYAVTARDEPMSERLEQVIEEIFADIP